MKIRSFGALALVMLLVSPSMGDDAGEFDLLFADQAEEIRAYDPHEIPGQPKAKFLMDMGHKLIGPGKISDVRSSRPIEFMGKEYFTRFAKEATLGSVGTLDKGFDKLSTSDDSFERHGFNAPDFRVKANEATGHIEMNGRSLASFTGSAYFELYAKLNLKKAILEKRRTYKVSFVAADLVKKDVIEALNQEPGVSDFLNRCKKSRKTPMYIMSNVIMLDTNTTEALDAGAELEVATIIDTDNELSVNVNCDNSETIVLTSPVIRCYEMFEIIYEPASGGMKVIDMERHSP